MLILSPDEFACFSLVFVAIAPLISLTAGHAKASLLLAYPPEKTWLRTQPESTRFQTDRARTLAYGSRLFGKPLAR
jgi:hypothetical protein